MANLGNNDDFFGDQNEEENTLSDHEMRFMENKFHNIGFQEAYDETNADNKLEEGFVDGFQELIDIAIQIGNGLGEVASESIFSDIDKSTNGTKDDENTKEVFKRAKTDIVSFLNVQKEQFGGKGEAELYFKQLESKIINMKKNEIKLP